MKLPIANKRAGLLFPATLLILISLFVLDLILGSVNIPLDSLISMMFGYITSSVVTVLMPFSVAETMKTYVYWSFGSFSGVTWSQMPILIIATSVGMIIVLLLIKPLNALLLGDRYAISMGINYKKPDTS